MPLTKLQFKPGINKESTSYSNEGGWFDIDKVRFRFGMPEKIGGWSRLGTNSFLGSCRALHSWRTIALDNYLGLGTSQKYYIENGQFYYDITPLRLNQPPNQNISFTVSGVSASGEVGEPDISTDANLVDITEAAGASGGVGQVAVTTVDNSGSSDEDTTAVLENVAQATGAVGSVTVSVSVANVSVSVTGVSATASVAPVIPSGTVDVSVITFAASNGSPNITVSHTDHGATEGDYVTFLGSETLGGNITANIINQEYKIYAVINEDSYTIRAREVNSVASITVDGVYTPTLVNANSSDTGNGGISVTGKYQITTGLDTSVFGNGWGAGAWSRLGWGSAAAINTQTDTLRLWTHDNFGEDLVMNVFNGGIFYWDASAPDALGTRAVKLTDLTGASNPPTVASKVIVSDVDRHVIAFGCNPLGSSTQDPLLIRFSDQENAADWTPTSTNTAGDLVVGSGSRIVTALETRQQILVFTDKSLHAMQFLGPPFTFGISMLSENVTIAGPNTAIAVHDFVFWMGKNEFYSYGGSVQKLPCTVKDYVFSDFNETQSEKAFASSNTSFSEVWWFYPSLESETVDRYVIYNYQQNIWYYGSLARGAWTDRGILENPVAAGLDSYLYTHESGFDDNNAAMSAYIESSQFDIGDGDNFSFVNRLIPDVTFRNSSTSSPTVTFTMKARNFPGGNYLQTDDETVTRSASVPIEQFTNQVNVRLRGRSMALRIESNQTGTGWRLGSPRVDLRPDGRR